MEQPAPTRRQLLRGGAALAATAALAPVLAACTAPGAAAPTAATVGGGSPTGDLLQDYSALKGKTIGQFVVDISTPISTRAAAQGKVLADKYGFTLEIFDAAGDFNKVNSTLSTWAAKGVAGVIDVGVDPTPVKAGIAELAAAGIPIGGIYAGYAPGAGLNWDVTTNEWINFAKVGTYVLDRLGAEGGGVALVNWPQVPVLRVRDQVIKSMLGFYEVPILADEVLAVPGQVPDCKQKVAALLAKYPQGGELKAIVAGWDEVGVAAAQAVKEAGRDDVFVVSSDGLLEGLQMIADGDPFVATCGNDVETMTDICFGQLSAVLDGAEPLATSLYVDAPLVTAANVPPSGSYAKGDGLLTFYVK